MKKKLKDVCDFYSGTGFPTQYQGEIEGDYPFYKVGDIANNAISGKAYLELCNNYVSKDVVKTIKGCILPKDTVVFAKIGEALKLNRRAITSCECLIDNNAMGIAPKPDQLRIQFFFFFMKHLKMQSLAESTTVPSVRKTKLENYEIEVPSMEAQEEIEKKLALISEIIEKRKQELVGLDELIKSRFVEMFGNPVSNEMCWEQISLSACIESIDNGKSFVCDSEAREGEWPAVLKLSAATYGYYLPEENKAVLDKNQFIEGAAVREGDLLFTRKNTPELVGMCAYVYDTPSKLMLPDLIFRLNTNKRCNKIFLWKLINHDLFRDYIQTIATGSAKSMSNISKERLLGLKIILPPIKLQEQFAAFVTQTDKSKLTIQKSLEELETLNKALMQKYFGGNGV
ncbi:restriction endonuclease subunit S [Mediterraneibacter glycyrrhizinilyticus]|uniref:restriction endonuclease subunit S n=1 Tax=Mediterraneibacter glycyrrhizinilyticus TaxID=342942 RepID=UPI0025A39B32|nr:restriction endonuclease subunit S [Mediterraneibacter glycyrrhizinilyticus]MDM8124882.1 restriction endonuclease subunit S [Mediterraneibacter glycyrrhizinilyticus]